jgi:hypothetical protein
MSCLSNDDPTTEDAEDRRKDPVASGFNLRVLRVVCGRPSVVLSKTPGRRGLLPAISVGLVAFALYRSTLLPGVDFGDTGSLQTTVGSPIITSRAAYPLYFAIGDAFVRLTGAEPAHALNLASALEGATACAITLLAAAELTGFTLTGIGTALLFAVSYTFWSQAVIAEVYALHLLFVSLTLHLLLRWASKPTLTRLTAFFACYALSFGNHLSMILLAPAYATFLAVAAPAGFGSLLRPRVIGLAILCACAGALQYLGNLRALWLMPEAPYSLVEGLQHFWFDVTKSDWRDTMVLNVPRSMIWDHAAMYWFDLRQQFGIAAVPLAGAGLAHLTASDWRRALLIGLAFVVNALFAYSYNVGDKHVFYLSSHLFLALLAGCGIAAASRIGPRARSLAAAGLIAYASGRAYLDYPALDRSDDHRPADVLRALTDGIDDRHAILVTDLNWQVQNGLSYFAKVRRPDVAYVRIADVLLYAPALIADNQAIDRDVVLTRRARLALDAAYGPLFASRPYDSSSQTPLTIRDLVRAVPIGTRYALCVLKPSREFRMDPQDFELAVRALSPGRSVQLPEHDYMAVAGVAGDPPTLIMSSDRPFRARAPVGGVPLEVRMDAWLSVDTIRRMGFGHVIAARHHTLIVERGVSFVIFDAEGHPLRTAYIASIFAPELRFIVNRRVMVE